jgi:hypothetical protein
LATALTTGSVEKFSCLPLQNFSSEIFSMAFRKQSSKKHLKAREQGNVAKD